MKKMFLLLAVLLLTGVMVFASRPAMLFLNAPIGAAAAGLGGAYTARADGAQAIYWNPAGLSSTDKDNEVVFFHNNYIEDLSHVYLGYSRNVPELYGTIGISLNMFDHGSFDRTTLQIGRPGAYNPQGSFNSKDYALGITYNPETSYKVKFGASLNLLKSSIDSADATGIAIDLGWRYDDKIMDIPYRAAIAVKNIGGQVKYEKQSEQLPVTFKTGLTMDYLFNEDWTFSPVFDVVYEQQINETYLMYGLETSLNDLYFFRIGYDGMNDAGDFVDFGFGIKYDDFGFNYAFKDFGDLSSAHLLELLYKF
jgi:hypothetical protein